MYPLGCAGYTGFRPWSKRLHVVRICLLWAWLANSWCAGARHVFFRRLLLRVFHAFLSSHLSSASKVLPAFRRPHTHPLSKAHSYVWPVCVRECEWVCRSWAKLLISQNWGPTPATKHSPHKGKGKGNGKEVEPVAGAAAIYLFPSKAKVCKAFAMYPVPSAGKEGGILMSWQTLLAWAFSWALCRVSRSRVRLTLDTSRTCSLTLTHIYSSGTKKLRHRHSVENFVLARAKCLRKLQVNSTLEATHKIKIKST